jgi:hypothetical protein
MSLRRKTVHVTQKKSAHNPQGVTLLPQLELVFRGAIIPPLLEPRSRERAVRVQPPDSIDMMAVAVLAIRCAVRAYAVRC